jgi:hypothetical protein
MGIGITARGRLEAPNGSLSHFFKDAAKVDITQADGFDESVDRVLCDDAPMVLADLDVRSGKYAFRPLCFHQNRVSMTPSSAWDE